MSKFILFSSSLGIAFSSIVVVNGLFYKNDLTIILGGGLLVINLFAIFYNK